MEKIRHLPYIIDEKSNRFHFYETLWKTKGLELLDKYCESGNNTRILDYGCGRGEFISMAQNAGYDVQGGDIDPICVELASKYGKATVLSGGALAEQFGEKAFDVVASFHVLEHVDNPKRTLLDFSSLAKKYVLIAVPNLAVCRNFRWKEITYPNTGHLQGWDHSTLLNLAENHCGLELVDWAFDATVLGSFSFYIEKLIGDKQVQKLETGFFNWHWPHLSNSVIGLFRVKD